MSDAEADCEIEADDVADDDALAVSDADSVFVEDCDVDELAESVKELDSDSVVEVDFDCVVVGDFVGTGLAVSVSVSELVRDCELLDETVDEAEVDDVADTVTLADGDSDDVNDAL